MTRHEARIAAFALIFETFFRCDEDPAIIYSSAAEDRGFAANEYVRATYFGVCERSEELDGLISQNTDNWKVDRMSRTAQAILRLATYELMFTDLPPKVAINEAVEIAKEFADEQEGSFVNGILNMLAIRNGKIIPEASDEN